MYVTPCSAGDSSSGTPWCSRDLLHVQGDVLQRGFATCARLIDGVHSNDPNPSSSVSFVALILARGYFCDADLWICQ